MSNWHPLPNAPVNEYDVANYQCETGYRFENMTNSAVGNIVVYSEENIVFELQCLGYKTWNICLDFNSTFQDSFYPTFLFFYITIYFCFRSRNESFVLLDNEWPRCIEDTGQTSSSNNRKKRLHIDPKSIIPCGK